ncbi:uncharacterized protein LOC136747517 isoform X5 [Amia ocellicauda]|uniref:uncharacterized protein LOC136747517 isoform X5 n=1 Tax=Amia ocellicauda TaxID=2972642 RepID=UPI0034648B99
MTAVLRTWLAVCCWALTAGFSVLGPAEPVAAVLGANVVLPCSVLIPLPVPELEIQWTKTDTDTVRTVHLFSEGESWPESQDRRYRGRAELFPEEIRSGNYSLRLRNVTVQDAGKYRCAVHTQHESNNTAVELKGVETYCKILKELSISVVHFALITLITAGFFTELIKIHGSSESETVVFNAIMFALISILLFSGIFLKACFYNTTTDVGSLGFFTITSFFDTILALFFGSFKVIVGYVVGMCLACVLLATVSVKIFKCCGTAGPFIQKIAFLILLILTITLSLLYVDDTVENDRGRLGRMCEMAFLFILLSPEAFKHLNIPAVPHTLLYMFGATAVAAVNACALAIELILKAENGQRSVKDLRVVVFPCESIFVGCWLLLQMFANFQIKKEQTRYEVHKHNQEDYPGRQRTSPIESMQLNQLDERERPDTDHMTR